MRIPLSTATKRRARSASIPLPLIVGPFLIAIDWPLAWFGPAPYSEHTFFPLWLGYILTADGIVLSRTGSSLLSRDRRRFALLFVLAIPFWWVFEGANRFLQNWHYLEPHTIGTVSYVLQASLAFSTVLPAVLETAEVYRSLRPLERARHWIRIAPGPAGLAAISAGGVLAAAVALTFPHQAFPLAWSAVFFILDPLNALAGQNSIFGSVARGRWDTVLVLFAAGITCGLFWEMWNYYSLPKWMYTVPYVGEPKIFEMPVLGYGGYLPFALELYALYQTVQALVFRRRDAYLRLDRARGDARQLRAYSKRGAR